MKKKYIIKIPSNTIMIYSNKKNIITLIGPVKTKSLKVNLKLKIYKNYNMLEVTSNLLKQTSINNNKKKQLKSLQGTTIALIKQLIIETSSIIYQKLKLIGVGYRGFEVEEFKTQVLMFKLGYSHPLYFNLPNHLNIYCLKFTKLFIFSNSYQNVTQTAALIRSYKKPEPYKGKGILYETEKIKLKEGKKI